MTPYTAILRLKAMGRNNTQIAEEIHCTRQTVVTTLKLAKQFNIQLTDGLDDREIFRIFRDKGRSCRVPHLESVRYALSFGRSSRLALYEEYAEECRRSGQKAYSRAQFYNMVGDVPAVSDSELRVTATLVPTKPKSKACALIYRVGRSNYLMAAPIMVLTPRHWVQANNRLLSRLPRNPVGYTFAGKLPKALSEATALMASHYGFQTDSRPLTHEEKALIESMSQTISPEPEDGVLQSAVGAINDKPLTAECPRFSVESAWAAEFKTMERQPPEPYDLLEIKHPAVQSNLHVDLDSRYYSVPFEHRHSEITAYVTDRRVCLYSDDELVAEHEIPTNNRTRYSTNAARLPADEDIPKGETSAHSLRWWASRLGPNIYKLIDSILSSGPYEVWGFKRCESILHWADRDAGKARALDEACERELHAGSRFNHLRLEQFFHEALVKHEASQRSKPHAS